MSGREEKNSGFSARKWAALLLGVPAALYAAARGSYTLYSYATTPNPDGICSVSFGGNITGKEGCVPTYNYKAYPTGFANCEVWHDVFGCDKDRVSFVLPEKNYRGKPSQFAGVTSYYRDEGKRRCFSPDSSFHYFESGQPYERDLTVVCNDGERKVVHVSIYTRELARNALEERKAQCGESQDVAEVRDALGLGVASSLEVSSRAVIQCG